MRFFRIKAFAARQGLTSEDAQWIKFYVKDVRRNGSSWLLLDDKQRGQFMGLLAVASELNNVIPYDAEFVKLRAKCSDDVDLGVFSDMIEVYDNAELCSLANEHALESSIFSNPPTESSIFSTNRLTSSNEKERKRERGTIGGRVEKESKSKNKSKNKEQDPCPVPGDKEKIPFAAIMDFLNATRGLEGRYKFRNTEGHRKLIQARFRDGYTLEDFKDVITVKCGEWKAGEIDGKPADGFLRPATLFGPRFDGYLAQAAGVRQRTSRGAETERLKEAQEVDDEKENALQSRHALLRWYKSGATRGGGRFKMPLDVHEKNVAEAKKLLGEEL